MSDYYDRERAIREEIAKPEKGCYTGPIEQVKPGDVLSWERYDEYREFMRAKKNMTNIKLWGITEKVIDQGQRPFAANYAAPQQKEGEKEDSPNPFL